MFHLENSNFHSTINEESVLSISKFVEWKKKANQYNFKSLPKTAIITLSKKSLPNYYFKKKIKGLKSNTYIINEHLLFCSNFGEGGASIIGLLEELRAFNVQNFIFVGIAGIINNNIGENEILVVNNTFSTTGASYFYSKLSENKILNYDWALKYSKLFSAKIIDTWSTDCPFRETPSLIAYFKNKGVSLVEMETASIYAFSSFYNLNSICIIVSADSLIDKVWKFPENMYLINQNIKNIIKELIKEYDRK